MTLGVLNIVLIHVETAIARLSVERKFLTTICKNDMNNFTTGQYL